MPKSSLSKNKTMDFGSGSILKILLVSIFPLLIGQLLNLLYNIVDRIYIAHIPGTGASALAGIGLCFPIIMIINAFANLFSSGGASLAAIAWGQGKTEESEKIMNTSFYLILFSSLILMAIGLVFAGPLLSLFGADEEMRAFSVNYLRIYLCGTFFSMVASGLNPYFNAQSRFLSGMLCVFLGALTNLILDPLFIFVLDLGIDGAAIATVISQFLSGCLALYLMIKPTSFWRIKPFNKSLLNLERIKNLLSLGMVGFIMTVTNSLVQIVGNHMLMITGGSIYVSVLTILNSVRQITDTVQSAISDGSSPMLSYCYGSGQYGRVRKTIVIMTLLSVGYAGIIWILVLRFPELFIQLFDGDGSLMDLAVPALHLFFFAFVFQALQYSGQVVFKSLNRKKSAIFFSLFRKVVMVVPLMMFLPSIWNPPVDGVFAAEPISNFIGGLACYLCMIFTVYIRLKPQEKE